MIIKCPICRSVKSNFLFNIDCYGFDNSKLYKNAYIISCLHCGHVFNKITEEDYNNLNIYYNDEYSPINLKTVNKIGDMPGSDNKYTIERYERLYEVIKDYVDADNYVLDIGCAKGGFLKHLKQYGITNLYGTDIVDGYLEQVDSSIVVKSGSAENIPYDNNSFDFIMIDQVLEHLLDPDKAFIEARRVLKDDGYFCISVPDSMYYAETSFFEYYWFLLREHIQHFDIEHLELLANKNGFELVSSENYIAKMMSESTDIPFLTAVFKKSLINEIEIKYCDGLYNKLSLVYGENECSKYVKHFELIDNILKKVVVDVSPVYMYGIGREAQFLYENTNLRAYRNVVLIDNNEFKQNNLTMDEHKIYSSDYIDYSSPDTTVLITATAHKEEIIQQLNQNNFKGCIYKC